jgi:hypothetical protein
VNSGVTFVSKVSKAKNGNFTFRINIPKQESEKLHITEGDYLFLTVMKAKWYHMLKWSEMSTTWRMLPKQLKDEITQTGASIPEEIQLEHPVSPTYFRSSPLEQDQWNRVLTNPYVTHVS